MLRSEPQTAISHVQMELLGAEFSRTLMRDRVRFPSARSITRRIRRLAFLTLSTRVETRMLIISAVSPQSFLITYEARLSIVLNR